MRKLSAIILTIALVFGMTQCKKNVETIANSASEGVHITLYIGDNGDKHIVHTNTGAVDYTDGDIIYVGNNNKYIGYLTYASGSFSGNISNPSTDDYLHFYFVGGCTPSETPVAGTTTSFSVDISDQSNQMPVLSYVHTKDKYVDGTTTYECMLLNKCGLVKFNLTNTDIPVSQNVLITGMNNGATVHFNSSEPFTYSTSGDGTVILKAVSAQERWAVLPVQSEVSGAVAISSGHSNSEAFTVPAVTANMYYTTGVNVPEMAVAGTALTFEAKTAGAKVALNMATGVSMHYSTDGSSWDNYSGGNITLASIGDKVMFRAPSGGNTTMVHDMSDDDFSYFSITDGDCYVYGNVMSLLYQDFAGKTVFPSGSTYTFAALFAGCTSLYSHPTYPIELPATTLVDACYYVMFYGCASLTSAPALPATTLTIGCYSWMFYECAALTSTPELNATTLAESCYESMFGNCMGLVTAHELPATTLATSCYREMFIGCTSLVNAPAIGATTLADHSCASMFDSCTGLANAPVLHATVMAEYCYSGMFFGCTSLETAPAIDAMTLAEGCYVCMFSHCSSLQTAPALPATTLAEGCYGEMFTYCTALETVELPATTLVSRCYDKMFTNCSSLNYIKAMFTTTPGPDYTGTWVSYVPEGGTFIINSAATWYDPDDPTVFGKDAIPAGWTVQTAAN